MVLYNQSDLFSVSISENSSTKWPRKIKLAEFKTIWNAHLGTVLYNEHCTTFHQLKKKYSK